MMCDVTLMYSLKLFLNFNGWETSWVDFLFKKKIFFTIIYPVKPGYAHSQVFAVIIRDMLSSVVSIGHLLVFSEEDSVINMSAQRLSHY